MHRHLQAIAPFSSKLPALLRLLRAARRQTAPSHSIQVDSFRPPRWELCDAHPWSPAGANEGKAPLDSFSPSPPPLPQWPVVTGEIKLTWRFQMLDYKVLDNRDFTYGFYEVGISSAPGVNILASVDEV